MAAQKKKLMHLKLPKSSVKQKDNALCPNRTSDLIIASDTSDALYH